MIKRFVLPAVFSMTVLVVLVALLSTPYLRGHGANNLLWFIYWPMASVIFWHFNRDVCLKTICCILELFQNPNSYRRFRYAKYGFVVGLLAGTMPLLVDAVCSDGNSACQLFFLIPSYLALPLYYVFGAYYIYATPLWHAAIGTIIGYIWGRNRDNDNTTGHNDRVGTGESAHND